VPPEAGITQFSKQEKESSLLTQNRTLAVDFLVDWARDVDGSPFCAVLGEPVLNDILHEVIRRHWKGESGRAITPEAIIHAVRERGAIVIFDGLDERIIPLPQAKRDSFIRQLWSILPPMSFKAKVGARRGKLVISCRSHYFPTITALSSAFIGEGREGIREQDYKACVMLPFSDDQVRCYLGKMLGEDNVDDAILVIRSVHNLTELSTRPFLLSLIAPELAELERMKKEGRTVLGVTLYGLFVEKWLRRDEYKHQFTPEHKLLMMEALAAHLCSQNQKMLPWSKISRWLDGFLAQHPEIRDRYRDKPAEVLNQDFRAATFCLRPDEEKDGFRFAHTSLYEYFLAIFLVRGLEENQHAAWDLPMVSDETLDFAGQLLAQGECIDVAKCISSLIRLLENPNAPPQARRIAFRLWVASYRNGWPTPTPNHAQLQELDLEGWQIGTASGPQLDLRGVNLTKACLDNAALQNVLLSSADATGASTRHVEMQSVSLSDSVWEHTDFCGGTLRNCDANGLRAATARWHDCDVIQCSFIDAILPTNWRNEAVIESNHSDWQAVLRQGHRGWVTSVAWSPDGTRLCSGSGDNALKVWDAESGRCLSTFLGHSSSVSNVTWSSDGTRLLSGSHDSTLKVWNAESGRCLRTLEGHSSYVLCVAWSPDGTRAVSSGGDGTIREWNMETGNLIRTWVIDGNEVALVDFAANRILHATPGAWRLLGWQGFDADANRRRLLPAEIFGPFPPW